MAEPARNYDPDDEQPVTRPNLRALSEGEQEAAVHQAGDDSDESKQTKKSGASGSALKKAEERWGEAGAISGGAAAAGGAASGEGSDQVGRGFNPKDRSLQGRLSNAKQILEMPKGAKRNRALIGLGVGGGVVGILISFFIALIPLKIENIVNNLEDRFLSSSTSAVEDETESLFSGYMKKTMLNWPHTSSCSDSATDSGCTKFITGGNPVSNLYHTWNQAGVEEKLAKDYGIEFKYNSINHSYYIKLANETDAVAQKDNSIPTHDLTDDSDLFADTDFSPSSRAEIRAKIREGLKEETLFNRVMLHFKFGRLLEEKYGIRRCIVFCKGYDQIADLVDHGKNAAKIYFVNRVITPRAAALGTALECLFDENCTPDKTSTDTDDTVGEDALAGGPESEVDSSIRSQFQSLFAQFGSEDPAAMNAILDEINSAGGLQSYMIDKVITIIFGDTAGQAASQAVDKALPVIGWINLGAEIVQSLSTAGPKIKKLAYITNASSAVSLYMLYRSYSDEVKTGQANATEVGQFNDSLGPQPLQPAGSSDPNVGGTASAEQSPLYQNLIDGNHPLTSSTSSLVNDIVPATAYAASSTTTTTANPAPSESCGDPGSPGPDTPTNPGIVCPVSVLGQGNGVLNAISNALNNYPGLAQLKDIAAAWNATIGKITGWLGSIVSTVTSPIFDLLNDTCDLPYDGGFSPYCGIRSVATAAASDMMKYVTNWLIPNALGVNMSGARNFEEMAAGADVSGNDYSHTGLGGEAVSNQQVLSMYNQQQSEEQYAFQQEPLFSRIFDTTSQYSLVSKIAMALPFNIGDSIQSTLDSFIQDPFSGLANGAATLFTVGKASADPIYACPGDTSATSQYDDFFCVTQYGYPSSEIPTNPEKYWQDNCSDSTNVNATQMTQNWNNAASNASNAAQDAITPGSGNPQVSAGSATAFMDPNTGEPVNTTTDPCLLIQASTGSAGALFDPSLLTPDDLADSSGSTTSSINGQNIVAQAVAPQGQPDNLFAIVFHNWATLAKTVGHEFKQFNTLWTIKIRWRDGL